MTPLLEDWHGRDPGREPPIPCLWCGEDVTGWDRACPAHAGVGPDMHVECLTRGVVGSVGHQMGWCHCPGCTGTMGDPPGVSRREAARLAAHLNKARHGGYSFICCPTCGWTSFHPRDIAGRYCGHCRRSHGRRGGGSS